MNTLNPSTKRHSVVAIALAGALALSPMIAAAQDQTPTPAENATSQSTARPHDTTKSDLFNAMDANDDGRISRDEMASDPRMSRDFDAMDTDKDGYVSKAEFAAYMHNRKKVEKNVGR